MQDFHFRLPKALHQELKAQASEAAVPMSALCREAVAQHLARLKNENVREPRSQATQNLVRARDLYPETLEGEWGDLGLSLASLNSWNDGFFDQVWDSIFHPGKAAVNSQLEFACEPRPRCRGTYDDRFVEDSHRRWLDEVWA